jgi:monoterpene epsilon-lactone hydrolase
VAFGGTSAGGGLALATTHRLKALDVALPGAIYAGTPWADLSKTGDTLFTNEGLDRVLVSYEGLLKRAAELYADGESLKDPLISPIYGDFDSFPPTIFVSGTRDMLLSDTVRTHQKIRAAGGVADLLVFEALSHAGYLRDLESPESRQTYDQISLFLKEHLR